MLDHWVGILTLSSSVVALAGCSDPIFGCTEQEQCGADGTCQQSGFCSFPDAECDSGQRYGELAAPGLAGNCVPVDGDSDAATSTSTATSITTTGGTVTSGSDPSVNPSQSETSASSASDTGVSGPIEPTSAESGSGIIPSEPDPYGECSTGSCEYVTSVCVSNGPFSMCSPPCTQVGDPSAECPDSPFPGFTSACLYTDMEQTNQSCFVTCVDGACPGNAVCTNPVCTFE